MSESIVQKQTGLQGLSTAILLPSVSLFGEPAGLYTDEVGPLTSVVGIGLFQRTVLTLQRAGTEPTSGATTTMSFNIFFLKCDVSTGIA